MQKFSVGRGRGRGFKLYNTYLELSAFMVYIRIWLIGVTRAHHFLYLNRKCSNFKFAHYNTLFIRVHDSRGWGNPIAPLFLLYTSQAKGQ